MGTKRFPVNGIYMEQTVSFGERLREERERLRLNQTAFAATGGVTKKTQMLYEAGERFPDVRYLAAVHEIGCDVQYVVTGRRDALPAEILAPDESQLLALFRAAPLTGKMAAVGALQGVMGAAQAAAKFVVHGDVGQNVDAQPGSKLIVHMGKDQKKKQ
ncbi:hypothetical protein [Laribacter hongkongensis]|uniref:hypothetical protein n=1 Tax=Laribacter hongkongensis TaxID=168471 RepID=UPI001EFCF021|nr:hypothetical protein [Laribacter hongkongensis]MCG9079449.1 hypothetical protein [Laribacter hongkongensis]